MQKTKLILFFTLSFIVMLTIMTLVLAFLHSPAPKTSAPENATTNRAVQSDSASGAELSRASAQPDPQEIIRGQQAKIDSLVNLVNQLRQTLQAEQKRTVQQAVTSEKQAATTFSEMAKIYESMSPDAAAKIIANLDNDTAAQVIVKMKTRQAAKILAALDPSQAVAISRKIANYN